MKKTDASDEQNIVTNAINAHSEEILVDIRAVKTLIRRNSLTQAIDVLTDLEKNLEEDYAVKNWQASLKEGNL